MNVTVKLFATFREGRFEEKETDCPDGTRITDMISELGIKKSLTTKLRLPSINYTNF